VTGILVKNGRYSTEIVPIPTNRYSRGRIGFCRYRRPLYLPKSLYT
jgi:hypothetical protein